MPRLFESDLASWPPRKHNHSWSTPEPDPDMIIYNYIPHVSIGRSIYPVYASCYVCGCTEVTLVFSKETVNA